MGPPRRPTTPAANFEGPTDDRQPAHGLAAEKVRKTDSEWRAQLTPEQYYVTRAHGTERAGTSPLNREKRQGVFACVCCGEPLFVSDAKFDFRHRLAELRPPRRRGGRQRARRQQPLHAPHRGALRALRGPPRPRLSRRTARHHGPQVLHQRRRPEVQARRHLTRAARHSPFANARADAGCALPCPVRMKGSRDARYRSPAFPSAAAQGPAHPEVLRPSRRRAGGRVRLAARRQLAGGDARSDGARSPDPRLPRGRERLHGSGARRHVRAAGRPLCRDEGAHQGGRQLGARPRRALRVFRQLRDRRTVSEALPAPARRRARGDPDRRQQGGRGPEVLAARGHRPQPRSPLSGLCRGQEGLRALHDQDPRPRHRQGPARGHAGYPQRHRLGRGQQDAVLRAPRRQPAAAVRLPPPRGYGRQVGRSDL